MTAFKDHFSAHAGDYARARPRYPESLFGFLAGLLRARDRAWDCATGNGQAAESLSRHFDAVIATDASESQISQAPLLPRVEFRVAPAESSGLAPGSVDLVAVAQALHWFDIEQFFDEVRRVSKPGGVLAVWCYGTCRISPECDPLVHGLYADLDDYWPPERAMVESGYRDIDLPGTAVECPAFSMTALWTAADMLAYLGTWSATQRYQRAHGNDPVAALAQELHAAWGERQRTVSWPLHLKVARL
ncbi:MAG: class I SAM-dependent methyltransferase [Woeseia sp.]